MSRNNILVKNIQKQIALNAGQLQIQSNEGTTSLIDLTNNKVLGSDANATNYVLNSVPSVYTTTLRSEIYSYAKGIFGGQDVPEELVENLASLATYYASQTGSAVSDLIKNGDFQPEFLATINNFLGKSIQFGYRRLNTNQPWLRSPVLRGNVSAAFEQSVK